MRIPIVLYVAACLVFSFFFAQPFRTPKVAILILWLALLGCRWPRLGWKGGLILAWGLWPICMPVSPLDPVAALYERGLFSVYVLAALLVWPIGERERAAIATGLGWAGFLVGLYGLAQVAGIDWIAWETPGQPNSFFGNANFSAHFLLLAWHLGAYRHRPMAIAAYPCMGLAMILSGSRAVMVVWVLSLVAVAIWKYGWKWWQLGSLIALIGGAGFLFRDDVAAFYQNVTQTEDYVTAFNQQPSLIADRAPWFKGKRLSLMTRVSLYSNSVHLIGERPWTGIGAGQFRAWYPKVAHKGIPDFHLSEAYRATTPHQLILEAAILYGIPWAVAGLVLLGFLVWRAMPDRVYALALISQLLLAMVSLNYQNPLILVSLILLFPRNGEGVRVRAPKWFALIWVLPAGLVVGLDGWHGLANRQQNWEKVPAFFPELRARRAFGAGQLQPAWRAQKKALVRDPFGPESIFNTGLVAWAIGEQGDGRGYDLAVQAFQITQCLYPNYRPADDRLIEIKNSGYWEAEWSEGVPCEAAAEERVRWADAVQAWRPRWQPSPGALPSGETQ